MQNYYLYTPLNDKDYASWEVCPGSKLCKIIGVFRYLCAFFALKVFKFYAITLTPYIISVGLLSRSTIRHEFTHIKQQSAEGFLKFCVKYVLYFLYNFFFNSKTFLKFYDAYFEIPYEKEAYAAQEREYLYS
jgi:hypothetical protein